VLRGLQRELGIEFNAEHLTFAQQLTEFLDAHLPQPFELPRDPAERMQVLRGLQATLDDGGWAAITWPVEYGGRAASFVEQMIFYTEIARRRLPTIPNGTGRAILGPTLIVHGSAEQRAAVLPRLRRGEDLWCQGFSEPEAGSDLASLRTSGVIDGDDLVINGQKIWTSGAREADFMFALVRTDRDAPKRDGISYLLVPMRAPGVTVRPITQISGDAEFNEVFLDDVRLPLTAVVGGLGNGWKVMRTTLANERGVIFLAGQLAMKRQLAAIRDRAREADAPTRERYARAWCDAHLVRINGMRGLARAADGLEPGPEAAMSKLFGQETEKALYELLLDCAGPQGVIDRRPDGSVGDDVVDGGKWILGWLRTKGSTIGGGTSEVQRNALAERMLGQPRDPWTD
jgi:alkylation response protein AidB-like acyl-CoA dehydrogenase